MIKSIILEGFDGAGKSTLATYLSKRFRMPIMHAGPPAANMAHAMLCCTYQLEWMRVRPVIWDRVTPISRVCYQEELPATEVDRLIYWRHKMCEMAVVIYCKPSIEHELLQKDYEPPSHMNDIAIREFEIRGLYEALMENTPHIVYDFTRHVPYRIGEQIAHEFLS